LTDFHSLFHSAILCC